MELGGPRLPAKTQTLVIGGGVIGACVAYYLTQQGRQIVVVEKGEICSGSSHGNAGWVAVDHSVPTAAPGVLTQGLKWLFDSGSPFYIKPRFDLDLLRWLWQFQAACTGARMRQNVPALAALNQQSLQLFAALAQTPDLAFDYIQNGLLHLYLTKQGFKKGLKEAVISCEQGIESVALDQAGLQALEPTLRETVRYGIFYPSPAHVRPDQLVKTLVQSAERAGAQICPQTEVIDFVVEDKQITTVRTTRGSIAPETIVLAAGAWSLQLARQLGIKLALQPAKGYSFTTKRPAICPQRPLALTDYKVAVTPMSDRFRFSSTLELAGFDAAINQRRLAATRQGLQQFLSGVDHLEVLEIWRGYRPLSADGLPIIGRSHQFDNLIFATGHGMLGITQGPITGKLVAQLVANERPAIDLTPFRAHRF